MHKNEKPMKAIISIFLLLIAFGAEGGNLTPSTHATYVQALQTADSFLWAWVNRDADAGRRLISHALSSKLQKDKGQEWFRDYMVGLSNPHHQSFEIASGQEISSNRFSFPVTLYEHYTGESKAFEYKSKIEVVQEGDSWRIDLLPITADNR